LVKAYAKSSQTTGDVSIYTESPNLIDNAVIHGEYTKTTTGTYKVSPPTEGDFNISHDRSYRMIEGDGEIILSHNNNYDGLIYHSNKTHTTTPLAATLPTTDANSPILIYSNANIKNRLAPAATSSKVAKGNLFSLPNMSHKSLSDVGFADDLVKLGQTVEIGFRTTDLAAKIVNETTGSITSTKINQNRHSTTFLSYSFNDVDAMSALRFVSKHDGQSIRADKFGNLHYTHQNKVDKEHYLNRTMITGGIQSDNIQHSPNRVTVYGKKWANNMDNVIRVDDSGRQNDGAVNEISGGIHVPTANTEISAQRIGQRMLATANRAAKTKRVKGILKGSQISPGDQIKFADGNSFTEDIVLETRHNLTDKTTDVVLSSVLTSIEDVLQKFQEERINNHFSEGVSKSQQVNKIHLTTSVSVNINARYEAKARHVGQLGFIIGDQRRGRIHGDANIPKNRNASYQRIGHNSTKYTTLKGK